MTHEFAQGWKPDPKHTEAFCAALPTIYRDQSHALADEDDDRDTMNYRVLVACLKSMPLASEWITERDGRPVLRTRLQGNIGSCVGNATATDIDTLAGCDIITRKEREQFKAMAAADAMYALGRDVAGQLGRWDGSAGSWAAQAVRECGTLHMLDYGDIDLRTYSQKRCKSWARRGVPSEMKTEAAEHPIRHTVRVESAEHAWSLIGNGYPINQCSDIGWQGTRDKDGAIKRRGSWSHSMAMTSRRTTKSGRRLLLIHQSWPPSWISGPYYQDQPEGSFWVDLKDADRAIKQGDTFAYSGFEGFVSRRPDYSVL